jgi:hypothetical protein
MGVLKRQTERRSLQKEPIEGKSEKVKKSFKNLQKKWKETATVSSFLQL